MTVRPELPPMPAALERLPVRRGYPVPWFVGWVDGHGKPVERECGEPDFRVIYPGAIQLAHRFQKCWICGEHLGGPVAFTIGPMCAVNRVSSEPPSHVDCADWAARACPFLTRPHAVRREGGIHEDATAAPGIALDRNPGVALVWITRRASYQVRGVPGGVLFHVGEPDEVRWYAEGREATRGEVEASIASGLPALEEIAALQPGAPEELERMLSTAMELLPA